MKIRPPTAAESYEVAGLMDRGLQGVDSAYDTLTRNRPRQWLARHIGLPLYFHYLNEGWIVEIEGEIAGWLYLLHHRHSTHINDIGVAPAFRRQGYGRRLITWAEQRTRDNGRPALTLAVTIENEPAVRLYEQSGFHSIHHVLWRGEMARLPIDRIIGVRPRELDSFRRSAPFHQYWATSLQADGHPVEPLLSDQASAWHSRRGRAWELWQSGRSTGYADYIGGVLRLLPAEPQHGEQLQASWSALKPYLSRGPLLLDLGSRTADESVSSRLEAAGWKRTTRDRMLMVKQVS